MKSTKRLTWKYIPENCVDVTNTGYSWKVHVHNEGSGSNNANIWLNHCVKYFKELTGGPLPDGDNYVLEQFHCHWGINDNEGSEHTVCGKRYSGEVNNKKLFC